MNSSALIGAEECDAHKSNGSRFNALKHGLTAKTAVLPGEDPEVLQAKIDMYQADLATRNGVEDDLAEKAALASWQMERAVGIQTAQVKCEILTKPAKDSLREDLEADGLGNRLLHDRQGPIEIYPARDFDNDRPRTSWDDDPSDPDHPAMLVRRLTASISGCRWLLTRWAELRHILKLGLGLQSHDKLKMLRLMGRQPINAVSTPEVARVFLACHVLEPQYSYAFQELRCEIRENQFKIHKTRLERWTRTDIVPPNRVAARGVLLGVIDEHTERLRVIEAELQDRANKVDQERKAAPKLEDSKANERFYRRLGSCNRLIHANLNAIHKLRRNEADGWGRTRQMRQQRAGYGKTSTPVDDRLVVDERGTVRPAYGYDGNLEEGLARFEAEFGKNNPGSGDEARIEIEEPQERAVPDFARWTSLAEASGVGVEAGLTNDGAQAGQEANGEDGFEGSGDGSERGDGVTQVLTEDGCQSNVQNEIGQLSVVGCPLGEEGCGGAGLAGGQSVGGEKEGEGDQRIRSKGGLCASRSGERLRGSAGASGSFQQDAGALPKKRRVTERYWKRDRKQLRKELAKAVLTRRQAEACEDADAESFAQMLDQLEVEFPESVKILREFDRRAP
jgi:hypothetical protein